MELSLNITIFSSIPLTLLIQVTASYLKYLKYKVVEEKAMCLYIVKVISLILSFACYQL